MITSLGIVLALGFPFFFWGGPGYAAARSYKAVWDLGHILFFALATILVLLVARQRGMSTGRSFILHLIVLGGACGVGIEIIQLGIGGRSVDFWDVCRDFLGIFTGLFFMGIQPASSRLRSFFLCTLAAFLLIASVAPVRALYDEETARKQFPVLADFETPF